MNAVALIFLLPWTVSFQEFSNPPELIRLAPPLVQEAFKTIQSAVLENEKLPKSGQSTIPLEARAEIWLQVGNPDLALKDYLNAYHILLQTNPPPAEKVRFLSKLSTFLAQYHKNPLAKHVSHSWDYFYQGKNALRQKQYELAADYFQNAVSLSPSEPMFYYFRAMTSFHLGQRELGKRDALVGAFLERNLEIPNRERFLEELEPFQGPSRVWLCEILRTQPVVFGK